MRKKKGEQHPTSKQLANLKKRGWRKIDNGYCWQSPYNKYYYSPQMAIVKEARQAAM